LPVPRSVPPPVFKEMLILWGWKVIAEDEFHWVFAQGDNDEPIILPKEGEFIAVDVMMNTMITTKMHLGAYLALKRQVIGEEQDHDS
jgi:hypothetical protein